MKVLAQVVGHLEVVVVAEDMEVKINPYMSRGIQISNQTKIRINGTGIYRQHLKINLLRQRPIIRILRVMEFSTLLRLHYLNP